MAHARPFALRARRRTAAVVATLGLLAAAGCGSESSETPSAAGTPIAGGSLEILTTADARSLDPFLPAYAAQADGNRMSALYDSLVWTNPTTGSVQPQLAESLAPVEGSNNRVWVLRVRPGVRFTDGTVMDAAAVKINWDTHAVPTTKSRQRDATVGIRTQIGADALELRITLDKPNGNFDRLVARSLSFIASPTAIAKGIDQLADHPVGAGPFMLPEGGWVKGDHMTLVKNPNYWQGRDKPFLNSLTFRFETSGSAAVKKVEKGKVDLANVSDAFTLKAARAAGIGIEALSLSGGQLLSFDTSAGPTANPDVRRAIVYALSGEEINKRVFGGAGTPARGLFNQNNALANPQLSAPENKPQQAAELFDKVTASGSKPMRIKFIAPKSGAIDELGRYMKETLEKYPGIGVDVETADLAEFVKRSNLAEAFDVKVSQLLADDPEPAVYQYLHKGSPSNCCFYSDDDVDKALDDGRNTTDPSKRRAAYTQLQLQLNRDMPLWVYQEAVVAGVFASGVTGVQLSNDGIFLFDRIGKKG
ncbi:ABC transporter substrate-binding protein [Embleya sp. NBC_00896]|uniref:ABC transporter substrate-binding protein n=1 Tax=Embleya sp. NBC_00896 TaxID=2975961 RepID=UPI003865C15D|nr:ABC transporter substrate-binding protein [Embleya sp. NBC_00896]